MHSLLSPVDMKNLSEQEKKQKRPNKDLTEEEVETAFTVLNKDIQFLQVDRYFTDPPQHGQKIALVSFVPSKLAKPDPDGFYGMMKMRGVYATEAEAKERAEFLIRSVDSYHEIFHVMVGRPFPITNQTRYSSRVDSIDIKKKTTEIISEDILQKKKQEKEEMESMKQREKELLEKSEKAKNDEPEDPFEQYITFHVKRAQLIWTYKETLSKMKQMKQSYQDTVEQIRQMDSTYPDYQNNYKQKYMDARKEVQLPDNDDSFLQYLGLDLSVSLESEE